MYKYSCIIGLISLLCCTTYGICNDGLTTNPLPVELGMASNFAILSKAGVSTVPESSITGNIGVSPIALTGVTGFSYALDISGKYATSTQVDGKIYSASCISPTPSEMTTTISNMETAYVDASSRVNADFLEYNTGLIGGSTLKKGLYKFTSDVQINSDLTIECECECDSNSDPGDIWIFQISGNLIIANNVRVILSNGAKPKNIIWVVSGFVEAGYGSHLEGTILGSTSAHFLSGSTMNGRVLVQTAVTLQSTTITSN
jgi:hypothetical protein